MNNVVFQISIGNVSVTAGNCIEDTNSYKSRRQNNFEVSFELVAHFAALSTYCCNGSITNHGKVITKHCTAHYCANAHCRVITSFCADVYSDGSQCCNGAARGTHSQRDEAAHQEQASYGKVHRNNGKCEVYGACYTASSSYYCAEHTCHQIDDAHSDDVYVTCTACCYNKLFFKGKLFILQKCYKQRNQERHSGRHQIKVTGNDAATYKQYDEYENRQQRHKIFIFLIIK